jgi:hypothetical protein
MTPHLCRFPTATTSRGKSDATTRFRRDSSNSGHESSCFSLKHRTQAALRPLCPSPTSIRVVEVHGWLRRCSLLARKGRGVLPSERANLWGSALLSHSFLCPAGTLRSATTSPLVEVRACVTKTCGARRRGCQGLVQVSQGGLQPTPLPFFSPARTHSLPTPCPQARATPSGTTLITRASGGRPHSVAPTTMATASPTARSLVTRAASGRPAACSTARTTSPTRPSHPPSPTSPCPPARTTRARSFSAATHEVCV